MKVNLGNHIRIREKQMIEIIYIYSIKITSEVNDIDVPSLLPICQMWIRKPRKFIYCITQPGL